MASITGWKCRWPNITASASHPRRLFCSDSTISRVLRAGDDEVEMALRHLVEYRVEHVFVVDEADARGNDRVMNGALEGERRRRRVQQNLRSSRRVMSASRSPNLEEPAAGE
jgi:hypothetical protein